MGVNGDRTNIHAFIIARWFIRRGRLLYTSANICPCLYYNIIILYNFFFFFRGTYYSIYVQMGAFYIFLPYAVVSFQYWIIMVLYAVYTHVREKRRLWWKALVTSSGSPSTIHIMHIYSIFIILFLCLCGHTICAVTAIKEKKKRRTYFKKSPSRTPFPAVHCAASIL